MSRQTRLSDACFPVLGTASDAELDGDDAGHFADAPHRLCEETRHLFGGSEAKASNPGAKLFAPEPNLGRLDLVSDARPLFFPNNATSWKSKL